MENLPIADKMILYHMRDTTLSAGPSRRAPRPRFPLAMPVAILLVVIGMLYFAARAAS